MADNKKLYKYTANKDPHSTVNKVILSEDGQVVELGGDPVWLTDEEAANAESSVVLEPADGEEGAPPKSRRSAKKQSTDTPPDGEHAQELPEGEDPVVAAGEEAVEEDQTAREESLQEHEVELNSDGTPAVPDQQAGGVVDPNPADGPTTGYAGSGPSVGDGQGSSGASGQDVGTTTGDV